MASHSTPEDAGSTPRDLETDLDPAAFLRSMREVSERHEREDAERIRKLEEEVEKGRQERAARRAERARSISPEKNTTHAPAHRSISRSNTNVDITCPSPLTPPTSSSRTARPSVLPKPSEETDMEQTDAGGRSDANVEEVPEFQGFKRSSTASATRSSADVKSALDSSASPTRSASHLARSGTLSWQRRPTEKIGGSRPTSMLAASEVSSKATDNTSAPSEPSREQIAASLGSRDPSWFKQTAERGIGSAAYRKSNDEVTPNTNNAAAGRRGLPGMSRESSVEPESQTTPQQSVHTKADNAPRFGSVRQNTILSSSRDSTSSAVVGRPDLRSLIAANAEQHKASPSFDRESSADDEPTNLSRTMSMSNSQAKLGSATERPSSPTKGMGGFVQSAMLKRSDSQNKRWSQQPGATLSRQNSLASRVGYGGLQGSHSMPKLERPMENRESSIEPRSRPTSSSNNDLTVLAAAQSKSDNDGFKKPALPHHSRSKSVASNFSTNEEPTVPQSPGSPSKRWSPTKSSWIESALTRPDSPKPAASKNAQPTWMSDLARANAQRSSADNTPRTGTPRIPDMDKSKPEPAPKSAPPGQGMLKRSESQDLGHASSIETPTARPKPFRLAEKSVTSPTVPPAVSKPASPTPDLQKLAAEKSSPRIRSAIDTSSTNYLDTVPQQDQVFAPAMPKVEKSSKPEIQQEPQLKSLTSAIPMLTPKSKPETPPKPMTDLRSTLKSRPAPETHIKAEPEFLSKFGNLRKAQQEKYVAPDLLKNNILRGKSGLAVTGGPVKTQRRDELKESLLAKKEDIKKAKEEGRDLPGQAHERKTSSVLPLTPTKPEALAKRELLARSDSVRADQNIDHPKQGTPEALARHKSLRQKPDIETPVKAKEPTRPGLVPGTFEPLDKQISAPAAIETRGVQESSRLAARFNPGLANMLARGPPSATPPRSGTPAHATLEQRPQPRRQESEPAADSAPLQDMRKDRAKGPKRRKAGAQTESISTIAPPGEEPVVQSRAAANTPMISPKPLRVQKSSTSLAPASTEKRTGFDSASDFRPPLRARTDPIEQSNEEIAPIQKANPQALPGSAASLMIASLNRKAQADETKQIAPATPLKGQSSMPKLAEEKPVITPSKKPDIVPNVAASNKPTSPAGAQQNPVPEFKGFGSAKSPKPMPKVDDNKENAGDATSSVKSAASLWGQKPSTLKAGAPSHILLPAKKDEDAALRSAGLLASSPMKDGLGISVEKSRPSISTPPASAGLPPKPAKPSRMVSGQLAEASRNKNDRPLTEAGRCLQQTFGYLPKSDDPLSIDTQAVLNITRLKAQEASAHVTRTVRKAVYVIDPDGSAKTLPPNEDYTFFDESVYVCTYVFTNLGGAKGAQVFVWAGDSASAATVESAHSTAKQVARDSGSVHVQLIKQGLESSSFLQAMGGIFVTRRGSWQSATTQYMLCGRSHLGHVVFDEVEFDIRSLCHGFVFLISYPITLQSTRLWLWKGSACSPEEISAARLAAMDRGEAVTEEDSRAETTGFVNMFGPGTTKLGIPNTSDIWRAKEVAVNRFSTRLYRIQQLEARPGFFSGLWSRRPSWNSISSAPSRSPSRPPTESVKVEAKELSPITQAQLDSGAIYVLDTYNKLYVLIGPLFVSAQQEAVSTVLLAQTLLFASDYAILSASMEDRPAVPKCSVLLAGGIPEELKFLFRHWDEGRGLWGTGGLMAGSRGVGVKEFSLEEVLGVVFER